MQRLRPHSVPSALARRPRWGPAAVPFEPPELEKLRPAAMVQEAAAMRVKAAVRWRRRARWSGGGDRRLLPTISLQRDIFGPRPLGVGVENGQDLWEAEPEAKRADTDRRRNSHKLKSLCGLFQKLL